MQNAQEARPLASGEPVTPDQREPSQVGHGFMKRIVVVSLLSGAMTLACIPASAHHALHGEYHLGNEIISDITMNGNWILGIETKNHQGQSFYAQDDVQNYHMDTKGWADIGYNFLVGEDGLAYEGRGWDRLGRE